MSKSVLISVNPEWCELIASGIKTVEVRKTRPKLETPFKAYIYCTLPRKSGDIFLVGGKHPVQSNGKVIGEFVCKHITNIEVLNYGLFTGGYPNGHCTMVVDNSALTAKEIKEYANGKNWVYGWHISDLKIYDKPRELSEFRNFCKSYYDGDRCDDCKYFIDGRGYEYDESDCGCDGLKPIERPPQSWCYVEVT